MCSLTFLLLSDFAVFDGCYSSFVFVCKELKISKIVQINQFFQVLNLICAYDNAFYGLITPMLMRKKWKQWCQQRFALNRPLPNNLAFKARLSAKPLICKWFLIMMQIKLIFTTKVSYLASFWKWDFLELGNGLYVCYTWKMAPMSRRKCKPS